MLGGSWPVLLDWRAMKKHFQRRKKDYLPNVCWKETFLRGLTDGMLVGLFGDSSLTRLPGWVIVVQSWLTLLDGFWVRL